MEKGEIKIKIRIKIRRGSGWVADGAPGGASVAAWETIPSDEPAFTKVTAGKQIRAHAHELITFSPRQKTDWGKKCTFLKIYPGHRITPIDTDVGKAVLTG